MGDKVCGCVGESLYGAPTSLSWIQSAADGKAGLPVWQRQPPEQVRSPRSCPAVLSNIQIAACMSMSTRAPHLQLPKPLPLLLAWQLLGIHAAVPHLHSSDSTGTEP